MRLFFALWPPPGTAEALARWAAPLQGKAVPAGKIHLTLAFLGDADPESAVRAASGISGPSFQLPVDQTRYWRHNRIVWAGPGRVPPALQALAGNLREVLLEEGFQLEARPFAAHVTLLRNAAPPSALAALPPLAWPVSEFALVASAGGYRTLRAFPLEA